MQNDHYLRLLIHKQSFGKLVYLHYSSGQHIVFNNTNQTYLVFDWEEEIAYHLGLSYESFESELDKLEQQDEEYEF